MEFLEKITTFLMNEDTIKLLNISGSIASFLSLFISFWVLYTIKKIRQFYLLNTRVPELINNLSCSASELSTCLNSYNGMTSRVKKILADIEISIKSLSKKVDRNIKKQLVQIKKSIRQIEKTNDINKEKKILEEIHLLIYKIKKEIEITQEDARWER